MNLASKKLVPGCPSRENAPLADLTTFRMGGVVPLLLEPRNREELAAAVAAVRREGLPFRMLGGGANVLIDDRGLDEVVIHTAAFAFMTRESEDARVLRLGAGLSIPYFVNKARDMGLAGAECLVGVPGTMGGATVMNAGGRHGWLSHVARRVRYVAPDGTEQEDEVTERTFGYRSSIFGDCVVLETVVELVPGSKAAIQERTKTILKEKSAAQPLTEKSAGCIFQNPQNGSAGKLIEGAGVKGLRIGGAEVSRKHGNFIVNAGGATMADVQAVIAEVRRAVRETAGVELETEVKIWAR